VTPHAERAAALAASLPAEAAVSATSNLVPRLSRRAHVYVFPAVLDADYVFLDLQASPAPTSAGDVFLRVRSLLESGDWAVEQAEDGLLLLHRSEGAPRVDMAALGARLFPPRAARGATTDTPPLTLVDAQLLPPPDGAVDVDGPHWVLHTAWHVDAPLPPGARLDFWLDLRDGQRRHVWDLASLWWSPPERWPVGSTVSVDISDVPVHDFVSWQATVV
jgi:hypothetical protein